MKLQTSYQKAAVSHFFLAISHIKCSGVTQPFNPFQIGMEKQMQELRNASGLSATDTNGCKSYKMAFHPFSKN